MGFRREMKGAIVEAVYHLHFRTATERAMLPLRED